ncbi:multicopper oxidase family protein [Marinobacter xestospongiae]|uniref:multicopper oxidase family protein n=1 Tax=Marinobacter xestospongiae TaxID=994319 RepID=UPI0020048FCD|nr:multicopper oxidase family protein [Marinobacter xestospongiae]MCK7567543.1 multicopper oxidase family protein [Marinobacter xestospongiae]
MPLNRRQFLQSTLALGALSQLPRLSLAASPSADVDYELTVAPADIQLVDAGTTPAWCFNGGYPAPVIRARQHQPIRIRVRNQLAEPTTIHWHGLRIPIAMDGVPFLSQAPIPAGGEFLYEFTPPDAGTFWYHPHMNSVEQLGRGLVGAFIVEEAQPVAFDSEQVLGLKNWHVKADGSFDRLSRPRYAARMGTPGQLQTVNGQQHPSYPVPAGGSVRLRFLNLDNTVTYDLTSSVEDARILAVDGNPLAQPVTLERHAMGPGMRVDVGLLAPAAGETVTFYHKGKPLVTLHSEPGEVRHSQIPALPLNPVPAPDLANAETLSFVFEWDAAISPVAKQGEASGPSFWTINRRSWEGMSQGNIPEPLARLKLGQTYIFELENLTQYHHPIHIHGHTFTVLSSDKRAIEPFHTDTVLLGKNEKVLAAFVADNPGRWMYHCHVIEHLKTGLMGYIEVS